LFLLNNKKERRRNAILLSFGVSKTPMPDNAAKERAPRMSECETTTTNKAKLDHNLELMGIDAHF
jgi:hypothetical protein